MRARNPSGEQLLSLLIMEVSAFKDGEQWLCHMSVYISRQRHQYPL